MSICNFGLILLSDVLTNWHKFVSFFFYLSRLIILSLLLVNKDAQYHTINTPSPEWPNSHKLKIQDGCGRHLEFRKNVNNFRLEKDLLHQIIREDASRPCGDDHMTKSRNRNLIRVTSSNECLKHMCIDLSNYNRYLNQIWYRTQTPHYQTPEWPNL